jgi:hypothetical protein
MLKRITSLILFSIAICSHAQNPKQIFEAEKLVWFGLDFTKTKFIEVKDVPATELKSKYFDEWNNAVMYEHDKFYLESFFRKLNVYYDITIATRRNETVNPANIVTTESTQITRSTIDEIISDYTGSQRKEGVGIVFIVEYFNKKTENAIAYATFFDIATQKVLLSKAVSGKPGGRGLKNFWANAIAGMMQSIDKTQYDLWQKEVMK